MNILGLHCGINITGEHDSSAALVLNNKLVDFYEEERLNRKKHALNCFPFMSINKLFNKYRISFNNIDVICIPLETDINSFKNKLSLYYNIDISIFNKIQILFCDHHISHLYTSYFFSGFKQCAGLIIDAEGSNNQSTVLAEIDNFNIKIIKTFNNTTSLGFLYSAATQYCGLGRFGDGKFMGLSSYGTDTKIRIFEWNNKFNTIDSKQSINNRYSKINKFINKTLDINDIDLYENINSLSIHNTYNKFFKIFSALFYPFCKLTDKNQIQYYINFAKTIQENFNEIILALCKFLYESTLNEKLILGGGCALNCITNNLIVESGIFKQVYSPNIPYDAGISIGNALYAAKQYNIIVDNKINDKYSNDIYFIKDISNKYYNKISVLQIDNITDKIINDLKNNKIIGWFQDGAEYGPRALGHRSIIANPANRNNLTIINRNIKQREMFRPLAPIIPDILFNSIFNTMSYDMCHNMLRTLNIKKEFRKKLIAVCHIDNSTRPQYLMKKDNEFLYNLIIEFHKKTGIPGIINTSFNRKTEPIIETIDNAIEMLLTVPDLDYIIFNTQYIIQRKSV